MIMHTLHLRILISLLCSLLFFNSAFARTSDSAPDILLAKVLSPDVDPADYLVSEKYDGVRGIWDGTTLRFRSGRTVNAPQWFIDKLPKQALDGELWLGRGRFEEVSGIARADAPDDEQWRKIKYMVFELPDAPGTFEQRAKRIKEIAASAAWPQLVAVEQYRVANRAALKKKFDEAVRGGAEGLMLHLASAEYVTGRSDVLLKLKPLEDTEAVVIAHIPGKGKYTGQLGALRVETPEGKQFSIGTGFSDSVRANPPAVGATVTYTYRGLTKKGLPRFASFLRVRNRE